MKKAKLFLLMFLASTFSWADTSGEPVKITSTCNLVYSVSEPIVQAPEVKGYLAVISNAPGCEQYADDATEAEMEWYGPHGPFGSGWYYIIEEEETYEYYLTLCNESGGASNMLEPIFIAN